MRDLETLSWDELCDVLSPRHPDTGAEPPDFRGVLVTDAYVAATRRYGPGREI